MRYSISFIFIMSCFFCFSQEEKVVYKNNLPRFSIRANVAIPKAVTSEVLRHSFAGVLTGDANVNYKLFSGFFVGLGYSYSYYKTQKAFYYQNIYTNMQTHNGYLKLGYDKFFDKNAFYTISLNAGYNYNAFQGIKYKNDSLIGKYPTNFGGGFIEPMFGLYFIVDPNFAIGGHISYNYTFSQFNPAYAGLDKWYEYKGLKNNWSMSAITFGFGFYYGISRK